MIAHDLDGIESRLYVGTNVFLDNKRVLVFGSRGWNSDVTEPVNK